MPSLAPRRTSLAAGLSVLALVAAGCGSSDSSSTTSASAAGPQGRGPGGFAQLTDAQRSCLAKAGVDFPGAGGRRRGGRPTGPGGPTGRGGFGGRGRGQRPTGQGGPRGRGGAGFAKTRAALAKCGVKLPQGGPGGGPGGGAGAPPGAPGAGGPDGSNS